MKPATLSIAAVVFLSLLSVPAQAGTVCKSHFVSMAAVGDSQAEAAWSKKVRRAYGAAWSNLDIARNRRYENQPLGIVTMVVITAQPCKRT